MKNTDPDPNPNPNPTNGTPNSQEESRRQHCINWLNKYRYKKKDPHNEMRNVLLIVSALIAAVTFQAGVSPPGGVWQDSSKDHIAGSAIYSAHKTPFYTFLIFNTLALSSSVFVIISLTFLFPFSIEIWIAVISMLITYGSSVFGIIPRHGDYKFRYLLFTAAFPIVARVAVQVFRYGKRKLFPDFHFRKYFGCHPDQAPPGPAQPCNNCCCCSRVARSIPDP